jgi:dTDP-4-amino-4,6-dideoxygalactose transaminase
MRRIPYGKQEITDEDIEAVSQDLKSDFITQGSRGKEFEEAFAKYIGSKYACSVSNGTAALDLCVKGFANQVG